MKKKIPFGKIRIEALYRPEGQATSQQAAEGLTDIGVTRVQTNVVTIHQVHDGLEDTALLSWYRVIDPDVPDSSPRKRRCDLTRMGVILDLGRRKVVRGQTVVVWEVAPAYRNATVELS